MVQRIQTIMLYCVINYINILSFGLGFRGKQSADVSQIAGKKKRLAYFKVIL